MAVSAGVSPPLFAAAKAGAPLAHSPVPRVVAAPMASPVRKTERWLVQDVLLLIAPCATALMTAECTRGRTGP